LADALKGWDSTASYAQEVRVRSEQDLAQTQRITTLDSRVGTNEARVTTVETTVATNQSSTATSLQQLTASVASANDATAQNTAAIQQTASAVANTNGKLSAIWSVKMELTSNGTPYAAGFGLGIEGGASGTTSSFVVRADTFAVMNANTQSPETFFAITGGQTFMRSSFIQDGTITNAKIGSYISSTNYVAGQSGWILNKDGTLEINGAVAGGGRLVITNRSVRVYDANNVKRVQLGDLTE
jgi:predicted phage tail protein